MFPRAFARRKAMRRADGSIRRQRVSLSAQAGRAGLPAHEVVYRDLRDLVLFGDLAPGIVRLVADDANGAILGALEATVRLYANGCESVGVMFLEGIAVAPSCRETGIAAALLAQLEDIAREAGITEIASDSRIDDAVGADFHLANGFSEAERVTCFVRKING